MTPNNRPPSDDLDAWFPRGHAGSQGALVTRGQGIEAPRLGVVVGGSLSRGLAVKLDPLVSVEDLAVGRYVVVHGSQRRFFCMINDMALNTVNAAVESDPPDITDPFLRDVYMGTVTYNIVTVTPMLAFGADGLLPVKSIPSHFATVMNATADDVNEVFGQEDEKHFHVGAPLELEHTQVNLNLHRLTERSIGVFGKSGTGKSFLTRVLMAGILARDAAVSLIFDMHNDYGWQVTSENGHSVKGLKQLFGPKVSLLTLDPESSQRRGNVPDFVVRLGYDEIEPEDIAMLRATMNLSDAMIDASYTLRRSWGKGWVKRLIDGSAEDLDDIVNNTNIAGGTLAALQRRLERFERWEFLVEENAGQRSVQDIIDLLTRQRKSVVLEFGRYGNTLEAYMLVANYLTRRIHQHYVEAVEKSLGDASLEPPQLVITIEEAHKFLEPQVARQTTFGIIAREMRKYKVTLLIVDQRPSAIDEEVMSQIGTRVTALLDNERDIAAVLNGVSGASGLREVLARLETKQQAIIMGHAVPMPVVIRPRTYDENFYQAVTLAPLPRAGERSALSGAGRCRI